ncbi:MAG: ThuA domain-containing protein [Gemmobacter sp.]|nr:ThuA domain-containing protein [Gemmobacter sp.]
MAQVLILSGGIYHDFPALSQQLAGQLADVGCGVQVVTHPADCATALDRDQPQVLVVQALHWQMLGNPKYEPFRKEWAYTVGDDLKRAVLAHVARGGGIVALHTGCICFADWPDWQRLLGGGWVWGQSFHAADLEQIVVAPALDHPVTSGVAGYSLHDELYRDLVIDPAVTVLAVGRTPEGAGAPVAWVRQEGRARIATLTLGHDVAGCAVAGQAKMTRQAVLWAAQQQEGQAI